MIYSEIKGDKQVTLHEIILDSFLIVISGLRSKVMHLNHAKIHSVLIRTTVDK